MRRTPNAIEKQGNSFFRVRDGFKGCPHLIFCASTLLELALRRSVPYHKSWTPRLLAKISDDAPLPKFGQSSESRVRNCPGLLVPTSVDGEAIV